MTHRHDDGHVLTRDLLRGGGMLHMVARCAPAMRLLTDEQRAESLRRTFAARPAGPITAILPLACRLSVVSVPPVAQLMRTKYPPSSRFVREIDCVMSHASRSVGVVTCRKDGATALP